MHEPEDIDHLERSKMSFGQHLEELRAALVKSFLALFIGFLVGLACGQWIVDQIQTPLRDALHAHFQERAVEHELNRLQQRKAEGEEVPDDLEAAAREFAELELEPGEIYVVPRELAEQMNAVQPGTVDPNSFPPPPRDGSIRKEDMIRIPIYRPLSENNRLRLVALGVEEPFWVYLKASIAAGVIFASPLIFFFIWDFIAAGLYRQERKYVYMYLPISLGLFLSGAALAFFVAFEYVLNFLFQFYAWTGTDPSPRLSEWMSFVLMLPLGFGISFQLPLVMLLLNRLGVFTIEAYFNKWRVAVLVIAIISMFLTPADPGSMIVMATPLVVLYFGGILLCKYMPGTGPKIDRSDAS